MLDKGISTRMINVQIMARPHTLIVLLRSIYSLLLINQVTKF